MSDTTTITAYRAAAAKLAEALAREGWPDTVRIQEAAALYGEIREPRWITEAAQLRLMAEALLLEQGARRIPVSVDYSGGFSGCRAPEGGLHSGTCDHEICGKCHGQRIGCGCDEDEIVALVRKWREGVK